MSYRPWSAGKRGVEMTSWKNLERLAAKTLGGKRRWRMGNWGESKGDLENDKFSVECKYGLQVPQFIYSALQQAISYDINKIPMVVVQKKYCEPLLVIRLSDYNNIFLI